MKNQIAIGAVRTTHGVRGYLKVKSFSGETEHFFKLDTVVLIKGNATRTFEVEAVKPNGDQVLLKLKGLDNPEDGKMYSGWEIWVPREKASALKENEFYQADLIGCCVFFNGSEIGKVKSLIEGGGGELLEVKMKDDSEKLIPFNEVFVGSVDIKERKIELLEGWILD